jgi:phosphoenolpyruvate carboxylase
MIEHYVAGGSLLSRDIKILGSLLGHVIAEQHGEAAFNLVEDVRKTAKARRSNVPAAAQKLAKIIENTTLEQKQILTKAFANYFQLTNIAEDQQRIPVLRERESGGKLSEVIRSAILDLKNKGQTANDIAEILNQLRLRLVLTAHPSEAKRKEVLIKLRSITDMMQQYEREDLLPREQQSIEAKLAAEIEELWQTRPIRANQTRVADEVDFGLYFMTAVIMNVTVAIYDDLQYVLEEYYPEGDWKRLPQVLRYASWIGGDRDGNPNVTPETTMQTLSTLRQAARQVYLQDILDLREHLTQSVSEAGVSQPLMDALGQPNGTDFPGEPYRQYMEIIYQRLKDDSYATGNDFLHDLELIYDSLMANKGQRVATEEVRPLCRKVRAFGLHLTPLEIREDAGLNAAAIDELFRFYGICENYLQVDEAEKQKLLTREIGNLRPLFPTIDKDLSDNTKNIIATWRMIAQAHEKYGKVVIDTVIASMCKNPSDIFTMLLLATEVGVADYVQIAPLFETIDDLQGAPAIVTEMFKNPAYREHMQKRADARGLHQQIMIGYSDSSKDGGYLASNWNLYTAQQKLTETCLEQGVLLELFHGRGGSIGRGGGPTNRAIRSQPPASLKGGIKITEQGEVIAYRYSNSDIAYRHLQQVMNAAILSLSTETEYKTEPRWHEAMEKLSEYGRITYRAFVYENDAFLPYWQAATPITELSQLRISSRPAKRKSAGGFAAMRAIPWVFSWMQSRAIIPSWFGIGTAFDSLSKEMTDGLKLMQTMYSDWSFFRAVVDNAQLDVVKADMGIAEIYASLVDDAAVRNEMFGRIRDEHSLTYRMICEVTQQPQLLEDMSAIRTSIERRNPYVDPLNFIQVDLLRQLRKLDPDAPEYQPILEAVLATINGIAAGMKTTG